MNTATNQQDIRSTHAQGRQKTEMPFMAPERVPAETVEALNRLLADEYALFTKTLNYHWNVTGPRFYSVHEFLEKHYREMLEMIDDVAERVREIGGKPSGTMKEFCEMTRINESPGSFPDTSHMISDLLRDHSSIVVEIRNLIDENSKTDLDPGTEDFLTGLLKKHEEMAWMLKSTLG